MAGKDIEVSGSRRPISEVTEVLVVSFRRTVVAGGGARCCDEDLISNLTTRRRRALTTRFGERRHVVVDDDEEVDVDAGVACMVWTVHVRGFLSTTRMRSSSDTAMLHSVKAVSSIIQGRSMSTDSCSQVLVASNIRLKSKKKCFSCKKLDDMLDTCTVNKVSV